MATLGVMKRTTVAILCAVTFSIGAAAGAYGGLKYGAKVLGEMANTWDAMRATANVGSYVRGLESIRTGNNDVATKILEAQLDNELITLGALPREALPGSAPGVLQRAKDYRTKFPRKSSGPEAEAAIQRALAIAKE